MTDLTNVPVANDSVLLLILCIMTLVFTIHTVIVVYHWATFGTERVVPFIGSIVYAGVGASLLLAMLGVIVFM